MHQPRRIIAAIVATALGNSYPAHSQSLSDVRVVLTDDQLKCRIWRVSGTYSSGIVVNAPVAWYIDARTNSVIASDSFGKALKFSDFEFLNLNNESQLGGYLLLNAWSGRKNAFRIAGGNGASYPVTGTCAIAGVESTLPASEIKRYLDTAMSQVIRNAVTNELDKFIKTITDSNGANIDALVAKKIKEIPHNPEFIQNLREALESKL